MFNIKNEICSPRMERRLTNISLILCVKNFEIFYVFNIKQMDTFYARIRIYLQRFVHVDKCI